MKTLEAMRVLDLTHALAGPFCTYHLQLLGADVIKIERPGVGDDFRDFARLPGWDVGPSFIAVNAGKRSVTVDLKQPDGQRIVRRLAEAADVIVENLRPGAAVELGLGWEQLREVNPKLVYCSISGFGQSGDMRGWPAYDHTIQAMSGMMWTGGDDIPAQGRGFSVDCFSGYVAYASILAALLRRERTGQGQLVDVAMLDAAMVLMAVGAGCSSRPRSRLETTGSRSSTRVLSPTPTGPTSRDRSRLWASTPTRCCERSATRARRSRGSEKTE